jgi:hypothetical protein
VRTRISVATLLALAWLGPGCKKTPEATPAEAQANADADARAPAKGSLMAVAALGPLPTGPVAVVGDREIGLDRFRAIYDRKLAKFRNRGRKMTEHIDRQYRSSITERLVHQELLRLEAESRAIDYDENELAERMNKMRAGTIPWPKRLELRGESDDSLRELEIAKLRERAILELDVDLSIADEDIDAEYQRARESYNKNTDRLRIRRVVFETPGGADRKAVLATAHRVRELAMKPGADFLALGEKYSQSPLSGDMGLHRADRMPTGLADVVFDLEVGAVSEPVEIPEGFQLVKLVAKYPPGPLPKEAIADRLGASLEARKYMDEAKKLEKRLAEKYGVDNRMARALADAG